jgi:hypothetical protein
MQHKYDNWRTIPGHSFKHYYGPCVSKHDCEWQAVESAEEYHLHYGQTKKSERLTIKHK